MLAPVLQAAGYAVQTAATVAEAERALAEGGFAVVVSDVENGEAFRLAAGAGRGTGLIGLAGRATPALLEQARRSGFDDVVGTFDREGLLASVGAIGAAPGEAA